jgi:hypothetical protein
VQWCFDGASPPLIVEVSDPIPTPAADGKVCYVIYAQESEVAPHFLNGRNGIYVRTDEFSQRFEARLADDNELRHLLDRRKLVLERRDSLIERAKTRYDTYAIRTPALGTPGQKASRLELSIIPRFPARPVCQQENLQNLLMQNYIPWRQTTFPQITNPIVSQQESAVVLKAAGVLSTLEVNIWGMLFFCTKIDGKYGKPDIVAIHLYSVAGYVLALVEHANKMLLALGYSGPLLVETALVSIGGVPWIYGDGLGMASKRVGSELDDRIAYSITTTTDILREKPDAVAMDIIRYVMFSVNMPDLCGSPQIEQLIRKGYSYNSWPTPTNLRI